MSASDQAQTDPGTDRAIVRTDGTAVVDQAGVSGEQQGKPPRAIVVDRLVKEYHTQIGMRRVIDNISFHITMGEKIAVLGKNGAGKSTLVKLIGGVEPPTSGRIIRNLSMSWPLGFVGGLSAEMSGLDNIRFISRIYARDFDDTIAIVDDFAELGRQLLLPIKTYSSGMHQRLAFGLTLAIDFECFLIDEVMSVGDSRFQAKCFEELFVRRRNHSMVLISHDMTILKNYCNKALVLKAGRGRVFEDLDQAIEIYHSL